MEGAALKCFGVGDGWPCSDRNHSSFLYSAANGSVLLDCGEALSRDYLNSGLDYNHFDRIILSHTHSDHVGGFFMFMQGLWLKKRVKRLVIHMPEDAIAPVSNMLNACYAFPELFHFKVEYVPLSAGESLTVGDMRITPFPTTHLDMLRHAYQHKYPQSFAAFSFLFDIGGKRIAHSADLGAPDDLEPLLKNPVDLLVCELAHFKPKSLFKYLKGRPIKKILFIHVASEHWANLQETRELAADILGPIKFSFAKDGQEVNL
jgi:phosphoribosyl 1,2-cyclic phosphodiesterase